MVGILIVSHNKKVSEGIKEMIEQMVSKNVKVETVGGEGGQLGVSVEEIVKAVNAIFDEEGVIIFVDFGSSVIGARTALNFLDESKKAKIYIADAPILEGAFIAAVEISLGKKIEEVLKAVEETKHMKKIS